MAFRIKRKESVQDALRRIAGEELDRAIAEIGNVELDRHEVVHQVRKRCKKIRGLIRLVRPCFDDYDQANEFFRDAAAELSFVRDAQSVLETFDKLIACSQDLAADAFGDIRSQLLTQRKVIADAEAKIHDCLQAFLEKMVAAKSRVESWKINEKNFKAIVGGFAKTYGRGVRSMDVAQQNPSPENYHDWRKRSKYHWYHLRLIQATWQPVLDAHRKEVSKLCDELGEERDLTLLAARIHEHPKEFGDETEVDEFLLRIMNRRVQLRKRAAELGAKVFAEKPKHLKLRIRQYWRVWQKSRK